MRENKLLKTWKSGTIFQTTLESLLATGVGEIIVVTGNQGEAISSIIQDNQYPVTTIANTRYREGMTSSIQAGVGAASEDSNGYMICLSDMPFLRSEEYTALLNHFKGCYRQGEKCIAVPVVGGERKNPVIFSKEFRHDLLVHEEKEGCRRIVEENKRFIHPLTFTDPGPFADIDTPEDFGKFGQ